MSDPKTLPLNDWHIARGGRMVPFAGYSMPVQYEGIMAEHLWTREHAGLFDVSHMGQLTFHGDDVAEALETLLPGDIKGLGDNKLRYSMLLAEDGGIIDDLIVTKVVTPTTSHYAMVVNGACKHGDIENMRRRLPDGIEIKHHEGQALLALQGPEAAAVITDVIGDISDLGFMSSKGMVWNDAFLWVSRAGYTGEDGVEISIAAEYATALAETLAADERVKPVGLGARDSLRLEAGLPLYGHDLDTETTPVMADLGFAISKRRRAEGGFAGAERLLDELANGAITKRVGLNVEGRQPVREGAMVIDEEGNEVGKVTSGGFSPSLQRPIAMAYVPTAMASPGTKVQLSQRGKVFQAEVAQMPFVPHNYHRKGKK
nr:glycine cleavage system aminomethyltransferase GcvT [Sphingomicrobium marinum]